MTRPVGVSPHEHYPRVFLIDPDDVEGTTPEAFARDLVEAEGLRSGPWPARVEDRIIDRVRWLAVTMRVWRPRERLMDGVERTVR